MLATEPFNLREVICRQLRLFLGIAEQHGLGPDEQPRAFGLSSADWQRWVGVLDNAPLPPHPTVPRMLRHIGHVISQLDQGGGKSAIAE